MTVKQKLPSPSVPLSLREKESNPHILKQSLKVKVSKFPLPRG
jgi:hypothetical protein